jgi:hypothetical protein
MTFLRGGIRRALWNKSPIKLEFVKASRKRIANPVAANAKRFPEVWGGTCYVCNKDFASKDLEVDHLTGEHSLRQMEDIQSFVEGIVCVSKDGLGMICKTCHKAKSYSERSGMALEDAIIEKQAIAIQKEGDKLWLTSWGVTPAGNAKLRRAQIIELLKGETHVGTK